MRSRHTIWIPLLMNIAAAVLTGGEGAHAQGDQDPLRPAAIQTENVPDVPQALDERLRQYQNARSAGFRGWAPDGTGILVQTRFADTAQLHRVYEPGGRREQLTFFDEPASGSFIPKSQDNALLVTMSRGGDENEQILRLDRQTGKAQLLTDGTSRNLLGPIALDGSRMVVASNRRNGTDTDLYIADPRALHPELELLLETSGEYWMPRDWSPDNGRLLINRYVSINESYPAVLDVASRTRHDLKRPGDGPVSFGAMAFAPDGAHAYVATDAPGEFRQLARVHLETSEYEWLAPDLEWDVESIVVEPRTGLVAFTTNEDGASTLYLLEGAKRRRVDLPLGLVGSLEFSPDGTRLGFTLARPDAPADAYSIAVADGALTRWTYSEVGGLDPATFVVPRAIRFKSFDGRMIPAWYFQPPGASADAPVPVVLNIHGGPESQYQPSFSSLTQFYLNELGVAVIAPNVRGSAGYGKTYLRLDNAELREDSVRDIGALLDWIEQQPELNASRVAVMGGSYGGYMVLASLVHYGERLKAGVDIVGIASFTTFLKNTSAYRRDLRRAEYGDERDPAMQAVFERINPTSNAHKIQSALLVAHGKNDPRVPFSEAVQIAEMVRANGRDVWTVYADNEGHGFAKKANADYLSAVTALFLETHLVLETQLGTGEAAGPR